MARNEKLSDLFFRTALSLLLSVGLTLPLVLTLSLDAYWPAALIACLVLTALTSLLSLGSKTKWIVLGALAVWQGGAILLIPGGGFVLSSVVQVGKALYLVISGQPDALPLYGQEAVFLLAAVFSIISYFLCVQGAGFYPALGITLVVMMAVWFSGQPSLLLYCLPALIALVVLYSRSIHEDLPFQRVLPIAAIAVALTFLFLPPGRVTSPPLEEAATNIRQMIYDYLFFTEPRNIFSLASEGFYPEGAQQLGGPAKPVNHPVMTVTTPEKVLLRGVIKDEYTGRTWRDTTGGRRYLYISPRWRSLRDSLLNTSLPAGNFSEAATLLKTDTVSVTMQSANASTLFTPQRMRELSTAGNMVTYFNNASELFITRDLAPKDTYTVQAILMQGGDPGLNTLINALKDTQDDAYADIYEKYTVLPGHLEQQVFDLANRITENYQTPYDKALAIQNYLARYYRYTLDAETLPANTDFVTYFLLLGKEGYCTYFASAMTVLCRMANLPARYVEGYMANPDASGTAYVTGLDAHAWTEVYFPGFGWLAFDATPPQQQQSNKPEQSPPPSDPSPSPSPSPNPGETPTPSPAPQEPSPEPSPTPQEQPSPSPEPSDEPPPEQKEPPEPPVDSSFLWWLLLVVLAISASWLRLRMTAPLWKARRAKTAKIALLAWVDGVYDLLKLDKRLPLLSESPMAYAARMDREKGYPLSLLPMAEALCLCQYSRHPVTPEDIKAARDAFTGIYAPMGRFKKLRFRLYRALPHRKNKK